METSQTSRQVSGIEPTVFVVDDDAAVCEALQFLLSSARLPVRTFPSAEAFLESISTDQAGCLVLDVHLPGMSGFELQARLSERRSNLLVIFMTGKDTKASRDRASKTGAFGYVGKPLDDEILLPLIRNAMEHAIANRLPAGQY